jgi:hypothetical protein
LGQVEERERERGPGGDRDGSQRYAASVDKEARGRRKIEEKKN